MATADRVGENELELFDEVARRLRDAHRAVARLPEQSRMAKTHQLLKITGLAKRDLAKTARCLDVFMATLHEPSQKPDIQ